MFYGFGVLEDLSQGQGRIKAIFGLGGVSGVTLELEEDGLDYIFRTQLTLTRLSFQEFSKVDGQRRP